MAPVVNKTLAVLAAAGIGVVTYAIYFDHKRRTDADFRKRLRMLNLCILHSFFSPPRQDGKGKKSINLLPKKMLRHPRSLVMLPFLPKKYLP